MHRRALLLLFSAAFAALAGGFGGPLRAGAAAPPLGLAVSISNVSLVAHTLHIEIAVQGLDTAPAGPSTVALAVGFGEAPVHAAVPLKQLPPALRVDLDLQAGIIRLGGTRAGSFTPVPRFAENTRFPISVTVRRGSSAGAARTEVTALLPTVIAPGFSSERAQPDSLVLKAFARHGYADSGPSPTMFWFRYPSHQIDIKEGARLLADYVRRVVLPASYAGKINVIGYSVGGLFLRWNVGYNLGGWSTLVNRLVLVGVPNEGAVMPYVGQHAPSFLPLADLARTPMAQTAIPVFPFWRATASAPWSLPPDARNPELTRLNARPIPANIRVYLVFGSNDPRVNTAGPETMAGVTGRLPGAKLSFEPGDGIVLAASAQGLPIHGAPGVPGLADRAVQRVNLGAIYHLNLLEAGADRIAEALTDRFVSEPEAAPAGHCCKSSQKPRPLHHPQ